MDKFPLLWEGKPSGELVTEREALYTWFTARCKRPREGIWCAWVIGNRGELRIGVLEPMGNQAVIRRRFSDRMTQPLGKFGALRQRLLIGKPSLNRDSSFEHPGCADNCGEWGEH